MSTNAPPHFRRTRAALLGVAAFWSLFASCATAAALPDEEPQTTATPFHGLRELSEYERYILNHLTWAGHPDAKRLAQLRDAWRAMRVNDVSTARDLVEKDAAAGDANAQYLLAGVLLGTGGSQEHYAEAEELLKKAAEQGQPTAAYWLGRIRDRGSFRQPINQDEALYWYRMADALGDADAAAQICFRYSEGMGVPRDAAQGVIFCRRAAEHGSLWAMNRLGYMYSWGIGVGRDETTAFEWIMKAAVGGMPLAQRTVALRYLHGNGTAIDVTEAIQWLSRAADQGDAEAYLQLGTIYHDGLGGTVDLPKSANWFRMAALKGSAAGDFAYATALENGQGVDKDSVLAFYHYSLAALRGYVKAEGALARIKGTLSSDQIKRGSKMVEDARVRKAAE